MTERNYYEILGVDKGATTEQVREAYREVARVYHPDSNFYDEIIDQTLTPDALEKFKVITDAYNTLVNDEKRSIYDETLPPELKGWDFEGKHKDHNDWVKCKVRSSGVYAMGQFGNVKEKERRATEALTEEDYAHVMSVNDLEGYARTQKRQKIWNLFSSIFFPR